jgi:hypothetical protein
MLNETVSVSLRFVIAALFLRRKIFETARELDGGIVSTVLEKNNI